MIIEPITDPNAGAAERILAAAGDRRPALGLIRCPYCGCGELFFSIGRDERVTICCSEPGCADLRRVAIGHLPPLPSSWAAASGPPE